MIGRVYEVEDSVASVTAAKILLALTVPADMVVQIIEASLTVDLDTSEQLIAALDRATGTAAGGAAVIAQPLVKGSIATSVVELSAQGAPITGLSAQNELTGAAVIPSVVGWHYKPLDGMGRIYSPSDIIILSNLNTITSATVRVRCIFMEIGG